MKKSDGASLADCVHETIELWGTTAREVRSASLLTHSTPDAMNSHARQLVCRGEPNCPLTLDAGMQQITLGCAWWFRKYAEEQSHEDRQATPMRRTRPEKRGSVCGVTVIECRRGTGALARHASQERNVDRAITREFDLSTQRTGDLRLRPVRERGPKRESRIAPVVSA